MTELMKTIGLRQPGQYIAGEPITCDGCGCDSDQELCTVGDAADALALAQAEAVLAALRWTFVRGIGKANIARAIADLDASLDPAREAGTVG